jgi:hypothetical protein
MAEREYLRIRKGIKKEAGTLITPFIRLTLRGTKKRRPVFGRVMGEGCPNLPLRIRGARGVVKYNL